MEGDIRWESVTRNWIVKQTIEISWKVIWRESGTRNWIVKQTVEISWKVIYARRVELGIGSLSRR